MGDYYRGREEGRGGGRGGPRRPQKRRYRGSLLRGRALIRTLTDANIPAKTMTMTIKNIDAHVRMRGRI